ncbi:MAG: LicD family protein [Lachnospiraceae bacterium]|nr:LicD family protein [Lachnospiraceae bacterium]
MKFPKEFFREEERDGFVVAEMMKRAWAAELEVLAVVDEVCSAHDITWYAAFGTLLGAVRHHGFIPWDDDIDICMLRDDYARFLQVAPETLPEGFVLSGIYGSCPRLWEANKEPQARVIADETLFPLPKYMDYFHGFPYMRVGVDIFPMDYLPDEPAEQIEMVREIISLQYTSQYWNMLSEQGSLIDRLNGYRRKYGLKLDPRDEISSRHQILVKADDIAASADREKSHRIASVTYLTLPETVDGFTGYISMDPEWFGEGVMLPYENLNICAPTDYDSVMKSIYGDDYMVFRPFTGLHDYPFYRTQEAAFLDLLAESGVTTPVDEFCRNWHNMRGGE